VIAQVAAWALFPTALAVALYVLALSILPEWQRIAGYLRWQRHDRQVGLWRVGRVRP